MLHLSGCVERQLCRTHLFLVLLTCTSTKHQQNLCERKKIGTNWAWILNLHTLHGRALAHRCTRDMKRVHLGRGPTMIKGFLSCEMKSSQAITTTYSPKIPWFWTNLDSPLIPVWIQCSSYLQRAWDPLISCIHGESRWSVAKHGVHLRLKCDVKKGWSAIDKTLF